MVAIGVAGLAQAETPLEYTNEIAPGVYSFGGGNGYHSMFLVTDGGLHHQLAASGNFGQVVRRNYPVALATKMGQAASEEASVVGCLCTPLDLLADKAQLPEGEIGDLVVLFQSGAYGLTASPTAFLSHPAPAEVLV